MVSSIKKSKYSLIFIAALVIGLITAYLVNANQVVLAQNEADIACQGIQSAGGDCGSGDAEVSNIIKNVVEILLFVVGVASVVALIVAGIKYTVSGGDQQAIASAKNTVVYAIVGLVVALLAYVAVQWVFDLISGG